MDRGATAQKVLRGFQRISEASRVFGVKTLIQDRQCHALSLVTTAHSDTKDDLLPDDCRA